MDCAPPADPWQQGFEAWTKAFAPKQASANEAVERMTASAKQFFDFMQAASAAVANPANAAQNPFAQAAQQFSATSNPMLEANRVEASSSLDRVTALAGEIAGRHEAALEEAREHAEERVALASNLEDARQRVEEAARVRESLSGECDSARAEKSAERECWLPATSPLDRRGGVHVKLRAKYTARVFAEFCRAHRM